jgi:phosphatidylglycerophosphate synthase
MGNLPNWVSFLTAIIPTLIILFMYKGYDINSKKALACGVMLLITATANLALMTNFQEMYEVLKLSPKVTQDELATGIYSASLWSVMFPAIVGALGVNIITSWLQSSSNKN